MSRPTPRLSPGRSSDDRLPRRAVSLTAGLVTVVVAVAVAGCGSGSSTVAAGATTTTPTTAPAPTTAPPTTTAATTLPAVTGPVPAVDNATNLAVEPIIHAGTTPAPTQLTVADLVPGTGATPTPAQTVTVQYNGALYTTGGSFDSSWKDTPGQPTSFPLSGVVPGFAQAIEGMKVGGRREVVIPPALGYGVAGQPPTIPANATLVFVIDLVKIS